MNIFKILKAGMVSVFVASFFILGSEAHAYIMAPNILISRDLTVGSSGQEVAMLQGLLSELGYLNVPMGVPFGYYGGMTKNAVASYQTQMNIQPAAGYYGSLTKDTLRTDLASHNWINLLGWN